MKKIRNKFLTKLILVICLFLMIVNSFGCTRVYADGWGDVLLSPIIRLITAVGDGIESIVHKYITGETIAIIEISGDQSWWERWGEKVLGAIIGVVIVAGAAALTLFSEGSATPVAVLVLKIRINIDFGSSWWSCWMESCGCIRWGLVSKRILFTSFYNVTRRNIF